MKETLNQEIGNRLRLARLDAGYSAEQTADIVGCSPENYRRIENGVHVLTTEKLLLLHEHLNIDPLYLLTGKLREDGVPATAAQNFDEGQLTLIRELFNYCRSFVSGAEREEGETCQES